MAILTRAAGTAGATLCLLFAALWAPPAAAQTDIDIDAIRDSIADSIREVNLGAGYAAIVDFAVSRDISAAIYYPDEVDGVSDPQLSALKVPWRFVFGEAEARTRPFLQGHVAYQTLETDLDLLVDERIGSEWTTFGGSVAGGLEVRLGETLKFLPALHVGYGRIENRATYDGPIAEEFLQPIFSNLLFDWNANAIVYGASVGLDYRQQFGGYDVEVLGNLTHHRVESTSASTEFADVEGHVSAYDIEINAIRPTSWKLGRYPLALVGLFGMTGILGPDRDALGFDKFFEAGIALEGDLSPRGRKLTSLRFGLKAIIGPDVTGWGLIVGYGFD